MELYKLALGCLCHREAVSNTHKMCARVCMQALQYNSSGSVWLFSPVRSQNNKHISTSITITAHNHIHKCAWGHHPHQQNLNFSILFIRKHTRDRAVWICNGMQQRCPRIMLHCTRTHSHTEAWQGAGEARLFWLMQQTEKQNNKLPHSEIRRRTRCNNQFHFILLPFFNYFLFSLLWHKTVAFHNICYPNNIQLLGYIWVPG